MPDDPKPNDQGKPSETPAPAPETTPEPPPIIDRPMNTDLREGAERIERKELSSDR